MNEILISLPKKKFKALKDRDINALIEENLPKVEDTLKTEREEFLREKVSKLEEKLHEMEAGIEELREFYEKALKDKDLMTAELERLRRENAELKARFEEERWKVHKM